MWTKIKEFFKRFWYLGLVPIGACLLHLFVGSKKDAKLEEREKIQKKEVKEDKKAVEKTEKEVIKEEKKVEEVVEEVKKVIQDNLEDKAVRDEKASKYLPNL